MLGFGVPSLRGKNRLNSPAQTASGIGKQTGNKLHKDPRRAATSIVITASLKENEKKKKIRMFYKNNTINKMLFTI